MDIRNVCVFGGTGFVGSHIVHLLSARRYRVRVPTRNRERAKHLIMLPTVDVIESASSSGQLPYDDSELDRLTAGMDAVINLIGILHGAKETFERIHVELPAKILEASRRNRVKRFLHMSALHADPNGPSEYLRSKGRGLERVRAAAQQAAIAFTIFRPSVIFGRRDKFLNLFATLTKYFPIIMLGSPNARFQPVSVEDVGNAFVMSLENEQTFGETYDLCGPKIYTLRELVEYVGALTGHRRPIIGLNDGLSYAQARVMEWLPIKLLTRDNYYSMKVDSVCNCHFPKVFGFRPTPLEAAAPKYLAGASAPRRQYDGFRYRARR
jgi:uncharacterized protein YbjT (DUF2867 family)